MNTAALQALLRDTHERSAALTTLYASGTIDAVDNTGVVAATPQTIVLLGNNDTATVSANSTVAALGSADTVTSTALQLNFIPMGSSERLVEQVAGAVITVDPTQALSSGLLAEIDASRDTVLVQQLSSVLYGYTPLSGSCWGSTEAQVLVSGDGNLIKTSVRDANLVVAGHLNVIAGGSANTTVTLSGVAAAANVVLGGSGSLVLNSTAVVTKVVGGSGSLVANIVGDAASVIGGSGSLCATVQGNGGDFQTGSGTAQITYTGNGGVFATGSGTSSITFNGTGGLLYEASSQGTACFTVNGSGVAVYGGDSVRVLGNGNEVYTRDMISGTYSASYLPTLFTSGIGGFLPNPVIAAALAASGATFLPSGVTATGGSSCGWNLGYCGTRTIDFRGDDGAVHTGDRFTVVTLNGNNDSVYTGAVSQVVSIVSGSGNGIYAGAGGGINWYCGGSGRNYLDYQGSTAPVTVNLAAGYAINGAGGTDFLSGFAWVDAGAGSTLIAGCAAATLTVHGSGGTLVGGWGGDMLSGLGDNETFEMGSGSDTAHAEGVNATYRISPCGGGMATIDQVASGVTGSLTFLTCAAPQQLWFDQDSAGDLVVHLLGTSSTAIVEHWFATDGSQTQLASIGTSAGSLSNAAVNASVAAMAAYEAGHAGFNPATSGSLPAGFHVTNPV